MLENNHRIYLDNAATTPLDQEVIEAMLPVMTEHFGNPSSSHAHGRKVKSTIEECRSKIASLLHCKPSEIFFTSGGTEADNIALRCSIESLGVKHLITSSIEHHAVLHTAEELHESGKVELHLVNILPNGHIDLKHLSELLTQFPGALVSLMHANNEIGNLLDVNAVGTLVRNANGYFHCDTVQTMGHFPFNLEESNIDFLCAAAHKFNGPKGVGFLYINKRVRIKPLITGGAQEREMRGGTENVYGIVGLTKALEISYRDIEKKKTHITNLKSEMIRLLQQEIPGIEFNGDYNGECLYTVLSTSFPPNNAGNMLLFNLDIAGISASGGSACSSGAVGGSHVINTIKPNSDRTTVRFSFGKYNTLEDIQKTVETLKNWYA
jgi:cysteine desulfurase